MSGAVGFLEEVALRWGFAEPTGQPDRLSPAPARAWARPPLYGSPLPTAKETPLPRDRVEPDPTFFTVPMPRHCGPSGPGIPGWAWSPQRTELTPHSFAEAPSWDRDVHHLPARRHDAGLDPALCPRRSAELQPPAYETLLFVLE